MLKPLSNGSSSRGAQMGRRDTVSVNAQTIQPKFYLQKLRWVSGDYDQAGAYWGNSGGTSIYWGQAEVEGEDLIQEIFIRAYSRQDAKEQVLESFLKLGFLIDFKLQKL